MFPLLLLLLDLNSHSLDHNGRTTNDDNGLLLILLNKQAKWVLFVIRLLLPRFSFSLYWTLCHVCVSVTLFLSLSPSHTCTLIRTKWSVADIVTMERYFQENIKKWSGYSKYQWWWVCTWQLFVCTWISISIYRKYRMSIVDLRLCLLQLRRDKEKKSNFMAK